LKQLQGIIEFKRLLNPGLSRSRSEWSRSW